MQPMTIPEIISAVDGTWLNPRKGAAPVTAVCTDSRKIAPGCLFLPWVGERFDGHDFIDRALDAGAAGCLCARRPELLRLDKFYIQVADTRLALRALASAYRDRFAIPFVQVTGSVGKTTTKEMLAAVLGAKLRVLKTPENFNNDIGTPLTLLGLGPEHQAAVIETGMNHFGEIRYLGEMVRPDIAVISNIGDAHIEHLGSREGILKAKSEIFENLKPEGLAVLNGDDALLNTLDLPFRTVRCGRSEHCAVRVIDMADHGVAGITCTVVSPRDTYHLTIPAPGEHMAYSAAIAVAVGEELGLSTEEITRGAASYEPAGSRMRVLRLRDGRLVLDDCYNANPQSVTAALEILAKTECGRKVAVLDADITGPTIPHMFGFDRVGITAVDNLLVPARTPEGIEVMSINLLLRNPDDPVIWRGPVIGGCVYILFAFVPMFIVIAAILVMPGSAQDMLATDPQRLLPTLVRDHMPLWLRVLFFGAVLSAVMSTASATMLAPSTAFVSNILTHFVRLNDRNMLRAMRWTVFGFAIMVLSYSLFVEGTAIYDMVAMAYQFPVIGAFWPLVCGLYWKRTTRQGVWWSMLLGAAVRTVLYPPAYDDVMTHDHRGCHPAGSGIEAA